MQIMAVLLSASVFSLAPHAQSPQKPPASTSSQTTSQAPATDYSQEPYVIELLRTAVRFEDDGTGRREVEIRVRVQSEGGVRQLGQLPFGYNSANEKMEIDSVQVRKPDGSVTTASADAVQDLATNIVREAPVYTDFRQKVVTVPALRPGDVLSYHITTTITTPLAPGEFWLEHDFATGAVVLAEEFEVNIPRGREIKLKTLPGAEPQTTDDGARRIYRWKHAQLKRESDMEADPAKKKVKRPEWPAIQLTTFKNWTEVGTWYAGLERERATPTPVVRAKAQELTRDLHTDTDKMERLYGFVAKDFRYVSLSFGVGRYQPHSAEEVLANQYGDCKDKHTLLESLIEAVGLRAYPVLASSSRKVDPDVPSPGQFDHLFTVIPNGPDEKNWIWLDTTTEVAPFRLLAASLRKKLVLVIPVAPPAGAKPITVGIPAAHLVETPPDPPFLSMQRVVVQGQISELGKLSAKISYTMRGDAELALRIAFRRAPHAQWKELGKLIAAGDGLRGEVSEVQTSDPAATGEPFHFEIQISEANFLDWAKHNSQLALPLPHTGLPDAPDEDSAQGGDPIEFGSPLEVTTRAELELPAAFKAQAPVPLSVSRDYADYASTYKVEGGKITAERTLRFHAREIPSARGSDYQAFVRAVRSDENQSVSVETASAEGNKPAIPESAKPEELYESALAASRNGNFTVAIELFKRVVEQEPKHKTAWNNLGLAYLNLGQLESAEGAFRKQIEVSSYDEYAYNNLGRALQMQRKYDTAIESYRKQIEVSPLDRFAHMNLGLLFVEQKKYAEAVPELERALVITPNQAAIEIALGEAYLNLKETEKAMAVLDKAVEHSATPYTWNNVAYLLARNGQSLDRAQQYAESAVAAVAAELRNASIAHLTLADLQRVNGLAAYWDTLGWVLFQRGDLARAEVFVRASWVLGQHGEVGDHLAQILLKEGKPHDLVVQLYAQALATARPAPETHDRLLALVRDEKKIGEFKARAGEALSEQRTVKLNGVEWGAASKDQNATASAEFYLALEPGGPAGSEAKVSDVRFVSGDEALRSLAGALRAAHFPDIFPDATPTLLIRRGVLFCSARTRACTFTEFLPENVHTVD
jgi:tetratricopeptide (TPR) repeat protein/transglutaminase-like putative cysteine protease